MDWYACGCYALSHYHMLIFLSDSSKPESLICKFRGMCRYKTSVLYLNYVLLKSIIAIAIYHWTGIMSSEASLTIELHSEKEEP